MRGLGACTTCTSRQAHSLEAANARRGCVTCALHTRDERGRARGDSTHKRKTFISKFPALRYPSSVTRRLHVGYVGYRRNRHQHVGYMSVTRTLRRLRLDIFTPRESWK